MWLPLWVFNGQRLGEKVEVHGNTLDHLGRDDVLLRRVGGNEGVL